MGMSWIEVSLSHLEAHLREFFEGDGRAEGIPPRLHKQLRREIYTALKRGIRRIPAESASGDDALLAPDRYTLLLPILQAEQLLTHPAELDRLTVKIESQAAESGIEFSTPPELHVVADPAEENLTVMAVFSQPDVAESCTVVVNGERNGGGMILAGDLPKGFLIVNGLTTHPLTRPVINIGRDPANQVCVDDARVSRLHAQLRLIQGKFVIFDLDSKGGTYVNGVAVSNHVLKAGDVIQLAGVPLVYGLEADNSGGYTQELPAEPPAPEML
jgi:hypothetical protein